MGAACGCGQETRDISTFWRGLELRKITFEKYCQIYEKNQMNWLKSGGNTRLIDLKNCNDLNILLENNELSPDNKKIFMDKLNDFVNSQSDKLTFFTCLSFFTKLGEEETSAKTAEKAKAQSVIESLRNKERAHNFSIVFESLLKMAIKKSEHEDVTKLFIQLVSEFPIPFVYSINKDREEAQAICSQDNREALFNKIKMYNLQKFYEFMYNKDNISLIQRELESIYSNCSVKVLPKVRTTSNVNANSVVTPTPGESTVKAI